MGLRARAGFDPVAWLKDLTYAEIHAAAWGFGLLAAAVVGLRLPVPYLGEAFVVAYLLVLLRAAFLTTTILPDIRWFRLPKKYVGQIRNELPYYIGGGISGMSGTWVACWLIL